MLLLLFLLFSSIITRNNSVNITRDISRNDTSDCVYLNGSNFQNSTDIIDIFKRNWPIDDWKITGFFSEEYISDINVHWLKFSPPSHANFYFLGILYLLIMSVGITGNFLVIFLYIRCKALRTPANILIVNLAISDGFMLLKSPIFIFNSFQRGPAFGDIACRIYGFVGGLTGTVSIVTLSVISFDRYFVIKFPLKRSFSSIRVKIFLAITWVYGMVFAAVPALDIGFGKYTYEGYLTSCSFDYLSDDERIKKFIFIYFIFAWVVPFCLISFSYANIFYVVATRSVSQKKSKESFRHVKEEDSKKQEVKLAIVVFSTISLWFLSWTPYAIVALLGISNQKHLISPLVSMIPALFCKTASCINSYVYALSHPKFRSEIMSMCCGNRNGKKNHKVWSTEFSKNQSKLECYKESLKVDEEMIEINPQAGSDPVKSHTSAEEGENMEKLEKELKRQTTVVELLCLRPSFRNKPSSFRKLARSLSSKEKIQRDDDGEPKEKR